MSTAIERHVEVLLHQLDKLEAENETLQARIKELTELRPEETIPQDGSAHLIYVEDSLPWVETHSVQHLVDEGMIVLGWLPLPEARS